MIIYYLSSCHLPQTLGRLTALPGFLDSYPMSQFTLPYPWDFQYLILCRTIIITKKTIKTDKSIIIT